MGAVHSSGGAIALMGAAERLIARSGVWGVSLRQIVAEAGVKNASAVQYHFGTREALLGAVCARRLADVNAQRVSDLTDMANGGRLNDIRPLIASAVHSLAAQLAPRPEGNHYLRFLERCVREFGEDLPGDPERRHMSGLLKIEEHLRVLMPYTPAVIIEQRLMLARAESLYVLASIEEFMEREPETRNAIELKVEILIDSIVAMLQAPISPQTAALLGAQTPPMAGS